MANGKHPTMRYRIIHACLSSTVKLYWTINELIEKLAEHDLAAEKRSIERDFETMRFDERLAYRAPIEYSRLHKGYYYTDSNFTIDKAPLTEEDLAVLSLAANILHQYKGAKVVQQFEGMMDRLGKAVNHLRQPQNNKLIAFEHTPYYKGNDYFDAVLRAITDKHKIAAAEVIASLVEHPTADEIIPSVLEKRLVTEIAKIIV
jgi:predicted DNA-binding transcriptional regulator YafY